MLSVVQLLMVLAWQLPLIAAVDSDELSQLGTRYGTDKVGHHFTREYHSRFKDARTSVRRFLEVGVFKGASLQMWKEYFPEADIVGLDYFRNQLKVLKRVPNLARDLWYDQRNGRNFAAEVCSGHYGPRMHVIDANQSDMAEMKTVVQTLSQGRAFDVIIEDGSHTMRDQQLNLALLLPLVKPGGIYVIEDLHTSFQNGYDEPRGSEATTYNVLQAFNASSKFRSKFLDANQAAYLERWIASTEIVSIVRKERHSMGFIRKMDFSAPGATKLQHTVTPAAPRRRLSGNNNNNNIYPTKKDARPSPIMVKRRWNSTARLGAGRWC